MRIDLLSLFPEYFKSPFEQSILAKALQNGLLEIHQHNIRDWAKGKQKRVDDRPYGGGPGMVMMPGPVTEAIREVRSEKAHVVALSPTGEPFNAQIARSLAKKSHLVFLCGHYEGIDARVDSSIDQKISIGDYVLTNGCLAAIVVIDALARFIPDVLGHKDAAEKDSFESGLLDCPHYTRPKEFEGMLVPEVLLQGNHQKIDQWGREQSLSLTKKMRPDLFARYLLSKKEGSS